MAKAKLTLADEATFKATVAVPIPGNKTADVEWVFAWMDADRFKEFLEGLAGAENIDVLMDISRGWDLAETFSKATAERFNQKYVGGTRAVLDTFITELSGQRAKN